jgi:hypothetical protein
MMGWYVVSAYDIAEATRLLADRGLVNLIEPLTWAELAELTGCFIPSTVKSDTPAIGDIMFDREKMVAFLVMRD